jgi:FkbM family methyltransferase
MTIIEVDNWVSIMNIVSKIGCRGKNLGWKNFFNYLLKRYQRKLISRFRLFTLNSKYAMYPLLCRPQTTDFSVFRQIFVLRNYSCLDDIKEAGLIIDCGAYVGYSSAYFLSRYKNCKLVAIEPDPENFAVLTLNLRPYHNRVSLLQTAVWSHPAKLVLDATSCLNGNEWGREVRLCLEGESPDFLSVDIESLLQNSGYNRISILKIDIEGAESVLFSKNYENWIDQVDNIVIELHNEECKASLARAIEGRGFFTRKFGEVTLCRRLQEGIS